MHTFYDFITGPLLWISFLVFLAGSVYRLVYAYMEAKRRDQFVLVYWSWKHVLRSMAHWLVPYNTMRWRTTPVLTAVTFVFHILIFVVPIFLTAHVMLFNQWLGISWPTLPEAVADILAIVVVLCCGYFIWRRWATPEVRYVTGWQDWFMVGTVLVTFLSGVLAYHQLGPYQIMLYLHILAGEAFLVMIPFTRAEHMLYGLFMRGYIASEFGAVRHCKDW
ncbi:nitrate reductase [Desulfocurvibacter africanus]|uniref:TmcC family electron transfer complex membrane anchor subunit n=1 Tax=Desulfocurvibacter africanus TaxID=873 RepID=UPI0004047BF1|nr:nitrate reductase [Desulfocurvibacter africanus]